MSQSDPASEDEEEELLSGQSVFKGPRKLKKAFTSSEKDEDEE